MNLNRINLWTNYLCVICRLCLHSMHSFPRCLSFVVTDQNKMRSYSKWQHLSARKLSKNRCSDRLRRVWKTHTTNISHRLGHALLWIQCDWQWHSYFNSISSQYCYFRNLKVIRSKSDHFCQSNQIMCPVHGWDLSHSFRLLFFAIASVKSFCFILLRSFLPIWFAMK